MPARSDGINMPLCMGTISTLSFPFGNWNIIDLLAARGARTDVTLLFPSDYLLYLPDMAPRRSGL